VSVPPITRAPRPMPPGLEPLAELALDLRWTWSHGADELWRAVDAEIWEATRNAWLVLQDVPAAHLARLAGDPGFLDALGRLAAGRRAYLADPATWCAGAAPDLARELVAFFCMEFGVGEAVPLYAGGLGVLAGDYLKTASDLGVPMVGVGILFQEGYFRQRLDAAGWQAEAYPYNDPTTLPILPVDTADGARLRLPLAIAGRTVWLRAWLAQVGRVPLYLLDANDPLNSPVDRGITTKLYGGGPDARLLQDLVLGVGGWRLLEALGLEPTVAHLNEGHAAFVVIERARGFMRRAGVGFDEALWATRAGNVFTTHTPVDAGFDRFAADRVARYLCGAGDGPAVPAAEVLALGRRDPADAGAPFDMACLAVRGSARTNGVSRLHGEVSRRLFADLFPRRPEREVPIGHVTNGVHVSTWDARAADELWEQACGKDRWRGAARGLEPTVSTLSDERLWAMRREQRRDLVDAARRRLAAQLAARGGAAPDAVASRVLDPAALTLGFARRFAEYKRPNLLLRDPGRLARLLTDPARPAQLVVAGKAHPDDVAGKELIAAWLRFAERPELRHRVVFLEDYDLVLAEVMTQGVDVWINTPRRRWEACGTSGMKVLVNGGLNLSARDGWWAEVDDPEVGWSLDGDGDGDDAERLYAVLEREVVPSFYDRDPRGLPLGWLARIRASMARLAPRFSANRMLTDYVAGAYLPAAAGYRRRRADDARVARALAGWRRRLDDGARAIRFGDLSAEARPGGGWRFDVAVELGPVTPDEIRVELYAEPGGGEPGLCRAMELDRDDGGGGRRYAVEVATVRAAGDFTPRVVANHPDAWLPAEAPLVIWQR
jgi:glycogen phosphorylase